MRRSMQQMQCNWVLARNLWRLMLSCQKQSLLYATTTEGEACLTPDEGTLHEGGGAKPHTGGGDVRTAESSVIGSLLMLKMMSSNLQRPMCRSPIRLWFSVKPTVTSCQDGTCRSQRPGNGKGAAAAASSIGPWSPHITFVVEIVVFSATTSQALLATNVAARSVMQQMP